MSDPASERAHLVRAMQHRLTEGLDRVDPNHRLRGRPVTYRVVDARTLEITFRSVASVADAEIQGVKRLIGRECFCTVSPQTAESVTVRFVVDLPA